MKRTIGIFVIGLLMVGAFFPLTFTESCKGSGVEEYWMDLRIKEPIYVSHGPLRNWHTAWVWIINDGNYPTDDFHTELWLSIAYSGDPPFMSTGVIHVWSSPGVPAESRILVAHTFYWDNPDPNLYQAKVSAFADCYDEVDERYEDNNWGHSNWWA